MRRHVDNTAAGNVVDDDRNVDRVMDRLVVREQAILGRLVVVRGDDECSIGAGGLGVGGEADCLGGGVGPGAGDHRPPAGDDLDRQLDQVRAGADARITEIELNVLVQIVDITDDAERSLAEAATAIGDGITVADLVEIPYVLVGTVDEIAEKILRCRDRWGITYVAVRALDDFTPVIETVRRLEAGS